MTSKKLPTGRIISMPRTEGTVPNSTARFPPRRITDTDQMGAYERLFEYESGVTDRRRKRKTGR